MLSLHSLSLSHPTSREDLERIFNLEFQSFPEDESASLETILFRGQNALSYFYQVVEDNHGRSLVGFINGTCTKDDNIKAETMKTHDVDGHNLVIHSITASPDYRRKGVGKALLTDYLIRIADYNPEIKNILLLCKGYLISFYTSCGFHVTNVSDVCHGQDQWFEMKINLDTLRHVQLQIDAFTTIPYRGNPAAVVFTHNNNNEIWMQQVASENNLSETAFLSTRSEDEPYAYDIRWFTPTREVDLCGHATLAAAYALYETYRVPRCNNNNNNNNNSIHSTHTKATIQFHTRKSGVLTAVYNKSTGLIELSFPVTPVQRKVTRTDIAATIAADETNNSNAVGKISSVEDRIIKTIQEALNIPTSSLEPTTTTATTSIIEDYGKSKYDILVRISYDHFLQIGLGNVNNNGGTGINFELLKSVSTHLDTTCRGIIVTSLALRHVSNSSKNTNNSHSEPDVSSSQQPSNHNNSASLHHTEDFTIDFYSRSFFPNYGIDEDPVTGSAHCTLAPYWQDYFLNNCHVYNSGIVIVDSNSSDGNSSIAENDHDNTREKDTKRTKVESIQSNHPFYKHQSLIGYQASKRGGYVNVQVVKHDGDNSDSSDDSSIEYKGSDRVVLSGDCVITLKSHLLCF